jgi:hypothetical protein
VNASTVISAIALQGVLTLLSAPAFAVDYTVDGSARLQSSHDDNVQLSETPMSSAGHTASAAFTLGAASERTQATLDAEAWARRYNRSQYDSDDQRLRIGVDHQWQRMQAGIDIAGVRDSTLTSELLDSGRIEQDAQRHEQTQVSPEWSYQLSEADLLSLQGSLIDSRYQGGGYTDYTYWQTQLLWTHAISERLRSFVAISHSDYQSDPLNLAFGQSYATNSIDNGVQIGGDYRFSETFSASLLAGVSRNETDVQVDDPSDVCGFATAFGLLAQFPLCTLSDTESTLTTFSGSIQWQGSRNEIDADISRRTQPSSNGYVQDTAQLDIRARHRVWEHGTLGLTLTAGVTDAPDTRSSRSATLSRDFQYATLGYTHALSETWLLDCSYQYRSQQYETRDRIDSHVGTIGIVWKPITRHWSR